MSKTLVVKDDFLGVVAIGSVIGNLVQANEMGQIKRQHNTLVGLYRNMVARYRMLLQNTRHSARSTRSPEAGCGAA